MSFNKEDYRQKKIDQYRKDKQTVKELQPLLKLIYERQSANCPDCKGNRIGCNNPSHY